MATDKLINQSQGDDIINALDDIATNVGNLSYGEQTSADKVVAMTGYQKSSETTPGDISQGDTLNQAIGKLEKRIDNDETALADKQATLTTEQLAAVNSGIDSTKVGQIATNTTDISSLQDAVGNKVDKVTGKDLSSNDYSDTEKSKLAGIEAGAEVNVQADWNQTTSTDDSYIKNKPTLGTAAAADTTDFATAAQGTKADNAIPSSAKGVANGVAELDSNGKVPSTQLPSYVDDVLEYSAKSSFPATGETGKIYVDTSTNKTYRWSGSAYVEISASLALGETSSTAYYGDKGKTAYEHSQVTSGNPHNVTKTDVGLGNVGNFKAVSTVASQGLSDTEKSNARANIGAGTSSLGLGTSSSTAYRGDYGNTAYSHATESGRLTTATASGLYKVASTAQGHIASLTAVTKADITGLGIPGTDTNTHRAINVNGTQLLGDNTTALNIASGSNVTLTPDTSTGKVTIAATDTNTHRPIYVDGDQLLGDNTTALNIAAGNNVTLTPNTSTGVVAISATDTNTHRPIQVNGTQVLGNSTTALNLKAGSNVSLSNSSGTVTIAATDTTYSNATTSAAGIVKLSNSLTSTSQTEAATSYAVKQLNDTIGNINSVLEAVL